MNSEVFESLLRNENYLSELYEIKEIVNFPNGVEKIFACTRDKLLGVIISKQDLEFGSNSSNAESFLMDRISMMIKLIEENIILVENIWIEQIFNEGPERFDKRKQIQTQKFSKESYRLEYGLVNFGYYLQKSRGGDVEKNLNLLRNMLIKLQFLHNVNFSHLNLSSNNIYFNNTTNEVFLGPIKFVNYEDNELWYSSPEVSFINLNNKSGEGNLNYIPNNQEDFDNYFHIQNDIWSVGCIISEMFFISTPLFQSFSERDKIRKIFEIMGIPKYEELSSYINIQDYNLIHNTYNLNQQYKPLICELVDYNLRTANPFRKELYDTLFNCLNFDPQKRPSTQELINRITILEDLSFNYINKNELEYKQDQGFESGNLLYNNYKNNQIPSRSLYDKFKSNISTKFGIKNQTSQNKYNNYSPLTINTLSQTISNVNNSTSRRNYYGDVEQDTFNYTSNRDQLVGKDEQSQIDKNKKKMSGKSNINRQENEEYQNLNLELDNLMDYLKNLEKEK